MTTAALTLRPATAADAAALADLAALDSRRLPAGPHLVAESGSGLVAAISEHDGRAVADPFVRSAQAVELLKSLREQRDSSRRIVRARGLRRRMRLVAVRVP